jgi:hypothetical protein
MLKSFQASGIRPTLLIFTADDSTAKDGALETLEFFGDAADYLLIENSARFKSDSFKATLSSIGDQPLSGYIVGQTRAFELFLTSFLPPARQFLASSHRSVCILLESLPPPDHCHRRWVALSDQHLLALVSSDR